MAEAPCEVCCVEVGVLGGRVQEVWIGRILVLWFFLD